MNYHQFACGCSRIPKLANICQCLFWVKHFVFIWMKCSLHLCLKCPPDKSLEMYGCYVHVSLRWWWSFCNENAYHVLLRKSIYSNPYRKHVCCRNYVAISNHQGLNIAFEHRLKTNFYSIEKKGKTFSINRTFLFYKYFKIFLRVSAMYINGHYVCLNASLKMTIWKYGCNLLLPKI